MKMSCNACGLHFGDEFEKTLKAPCNYWQSIGMSHLSDEYKKKIWDALNMIPFDEIGVKYNLAIHFQIFAQAIAKGDNWTEIDPDYLKKTEKEKRAFQKEYFIKQKDAESRKKQNYTPLKTVDNSKRKKIIIN